MTNFRLFQIGFISWTSTRIQIIIALRSKLALPRGQNFLLGLDRKNFVCPRVWNQLVKYCNIVVFLLISQWTNTGPSWPSCLKHSPSKPMYLNTFYKWLSLIHLYHITLNHHFNPFPNKPWFLRVSSSSILKTLWEKEKLLVTSNFSFSHSVFYLFGELSAVFIKLEIVVSKLFQFGTV